MKKFNVLLELQIDAENQQDAVQGFIDSFMEDNYQLIYIVFDYLNPTLYLFLLTMLFLNYLQLNPRILNLQFLEIFLVFLHFLLKFDLLIFLKTYHE